MEEGPKEPSETHLKLLQFIHEGGGYSSTPIIHRYAYLTGITKQGGKKGQEHISTQLKWMRRKWSLIECPQEQFNAIHPERFPLLFKLTKKGKQLLKDQERYTQNVPSVRGFYAHQLISATWYQNEWLQALSSGIEFKLQHELKPKELHFILGNEKVIPDTFILIKPKDKWFLKFNEADRSTEFHKGDKEKTTWERRIRLYDMLFREKAYERVLDLPEGTMPLMAAITTSDRMRRRILSELEARFPNGRAPYLVHTTRAYGPHPKDAYVPGYFDALSVTYERYNYPPITLL
jgi:hypothetical protein